MSLLLALGGPVFGHTTSFGHLHLKFNEVEKEVEVSNKSSIVRGKAVKRG